ncbi:MAG: penicillin-binding protein 2 [Actinobacteria bacterium]|nr:penicillin-binding protein 2 [Actinomycetota bacterium]
MTASIRRVALTMLLLFGALFVNLNYLQVVRADDLASDSANARRLVAEYQSERGRILEGRGADTRPIAESVETRGELKFLRTYDSGPLFAHVTGYSSPIFGRSEIEQAFNEALTGNAPEAFARNLTDLLAGRERAGDAVHTTVRGEVQQAARDALGDREGAVVAVAPPTGEILALWSSPPYDPNELASHDPDEVRAAWQRLNDNSAKPLLNRALRESYPPGSTFKLITAAAALENGVSPEQTFPDPPQLELPQTSATIGNFGGSLCNGGQPISLTQALTVSCNTTFAQLGLELGSEELAEQAARFGFNTEWSFQVPGVATSRVPSDLDPPATAQSAIGQRDVRATPLQMAMVSAAIANDGVMMAPRLVDRIEDTSGRVIREFAPEELRLPGQSTAQAVSRSTANALQAMMTNVVSAGSGTSAAIPGVQVAGKTGTAQTGEGRPPTVWFVGFAPADNPAVAVAVVVPDGGGAGSEATGGAIAGPMAREVIQAALGTTQ